MVLSTLPFRSTLACRVLVFREFRSGYVVTQKNKSEVYVYYRFESRGWLIITFTKSIPLRRSLTAIWFYSITVFPAKQYQYFSADQRSTRVVISQLFSLFLSIDFSKFIVKINIHVFIILYINLFDW